MREVEVNNLKELIEYKHYRRVSAYAWDIFSSMNEDEKELLGKPFVSSIDMVGANISKAFCHSDNYKRIEFYTNAIVLLSEGLDHWLKLIKKRNIVSKTTYEGMLELSNPLVLKMKSRISSCNDIK